MSNDGALDARFTQSIRGNRPDRGDGQLTLELLQPRGTNEFRKMLYRRWTKKQNRVCLAVQNLLESLGLRGPPRAIGNHFGDLGTKPRERRGQVRVGAIAARQQHPGALELAAQLIRESNAVVRHGDVLHGKIRTSCGVCRHRTHARNAHSAVGSHQRPLQIRGSFDQGANGLRAGKNQPVKLLHLRDGAIERREIVRLRKGHEREQHRSCSARGKFPSKVLTRGRRARNHHALPPDGTPTILRHGADPLPQG